MMKRNGNIPKRKRFLATAGMMSILLTNSFCLAGDLDLNKLVKGELSRDKTLRDLRNLGGNERGGLGSASSGWYQSEVTLSLKAGQSISIKATVTGKERFVGVILVDPTGKIVFNGARRTKSAPIVGAEKRSCETLYEEVNASGKYRLFIASDQIGPFTLLVTDASADEESVEFLEARKSKLQAELTEVEEKLKAAKRR